MTNEQISLEESRFRERIAEFIDYVKTQLTTCLGEIQALQDAEVACKKDLADRISHTDKWLNDRITKVTEDINNKIADLMRITTDKREVLTRSLNDKMDEIKKDLGAAKTDIAISKTTIALISALASAVVSALFILMRGYFKV